MSFYEISPDLAKKLSADEFLTPPADCKVVENPDDPDFPTRTWREVFAIRDITIRQGDDGMEMVQLQFTVPHDVVSGNQGRFARQTLFFPWTARDAGDEKAQMRVSMNWRDLQAFLTAIGYKKEFRRLSDLQADLIRNMRVNAQVQLKSDNMVRRQNIQYFRAPK